MNERPSTILGRYYDAQEIERFLRSVSSPPPFPPATERTAWEQAKLRFGEASTAKLIAEAEQAAQGPIPALPATAFLDYQRTGQRERYNEPREQRRKTLATLVLAECLEGGGRFLDPVLDMAWAICEESTWATSAHQAELTDVHNPVIDIHVAMTALELAETHALLSSQLDPALGKRIGDELDRRCFTPYLNRDDFKWMRNTEQRNANNWNAVCNAGVAGAAIYMELNTTRQAAIIARAARSLDDYLASFDEDGGSSEGPGYWDFGFGYYTVLAQLLEHRTRGRIDFLADAPTRKIASYPLRTRLSRNRHVNFSDCQAKVHYSYALLNFLAARLDLPDLAALANERPGRNRRVNLTWSLRTLFWQAPKDVPERCVSSSHDWFGGMMWMIARFDPQNHDGLVLAAKGGHNGENHNHNDAGTFIVHVNGESLISDIGRGRYTQAYFGPQRYDHFVTSSRGHCVPTPNGYFQQAGAQYRAKLLGHEATTQVDVLRLELKDAYPQEAGIASLQRRIALFRESPQGRIEVADSFRFLEGPGTMETALVTFAEAEIGEENVLIRGERGALRIAYAPELVRVRIETYSGVDLPKGSVDIRRVVFALLVPLQEGDILLKITPEKEMS